MRIAMGSDHAGLNLKAAVRTHLEERGHTVQDLGIHEATSTDYPDWAHAVGRAVVEDRADRGVLVCGTGQGMAIAANKIAGVRAACVGDVFSAGMVAAHNDANVLCLGERVLGVGLALAIVDAWVDTPFEGGRHARRVAKMEPT